MPQQQFKGYSQDQMGRIASKLGHTGGLDTFNNYLNSNPSALGKYNALKDAAVKRYARGGMVKSGYAVGGDVDTGMLKRDGDVPSAIQNLFQSKLGRAAGSAGADYYANKYQTMLNANIDPETAMSVIGGELQNSTEGKQREEAVAAGNTDFQRYVSAENQVPRMYETLDYVPGRERLKNVDYRTTDQPIDALGRTGDNTAADTAAIQQVYQNQLGRAAGTKGADYYADLMAGGTNLDTVRGQIAGSPEAGTYNTTGQQQYVAPANRIDGVTYNETGTGNVGTPPPADGTPNPTPNPVNGGGGITFTPDQSIKQTTVNQSLLPELALGASNTATKTGESANQLMDTTTGQVSAVNPMATADQASTFTAGSPTTLSANTANNIAAAPAIDTNLAGVKAAQSNVGINAKVNAAQQIGSSVAGLSAAQEGTATQVDGAPTRTLQTGVDGKSGELVNPVADAQKAAAFTEQITAAQGDPSSRATVQGQLATLMTSFDNGNTPAWAAGAMRNVTAQMSARGIGSSSMAGQALIQAALETALPIANADAQTYAQFDLTNLNNRQQRAMLSAQQRAEFMGQEFDQDFQARVLNSNKISEIANMNFTATQAIAIENAQLASTVNLANLSNRQGIVMAEAAALSQIDISNLNNRQQEQVQNAKSFLDMDMSNLTNRQQTTLFKSQQSNNALLSDAASANASEQFNATSKNQTDQFFSNLQSNMKQFNTTQKNSQEQFNAGQATAVDKFNAEIRNQREQFNSQNSLVINQSNAQWRRQIATADTVAINRSNEINAKALLDISNTAYSNLWQEHRDEMDWTYKVADSEAERYNAIVRATIAAEAQIEAAGAESDSSLWSSLGSLVGTIAGEYIKAG